MNVTPFLGILFPSVYITLDKNYEMTSEFRELLCQITKVTEKKHLIVSANTAMNVFRSVDSVPPYSYCDMGRVRTS